LLNGRRFKEVDKQSNKDFLRKNIKPHGILTGANSNGFLSRSTRINKLVCNRTSSFVIF
jgi:hypothetical protein